MKSAEELAYELVCRKYNDTVFLLEELSDDLDTLIEKASSIKGDHSEESFPVYLLRTLSYYKEEIELLEATH